MGVWGVVVAGGLGIAYFINSNQQDSGPEPQPEPITEPGVGTGLVPAGSAIQPGGGSSNGGEDEGDEYENNSQWGNAARTFLIGRGHNPTEADNAVRKYLVAEQLTQQQDAMIQEVLGSDVGVPPEDLPPAPSPEEQSQGEKVPRIDKEPQNMGPQPRGTRPQFSGRVYYEQNGEQVNPGRQLVTVEVSMWANSNKDPRFWIVASKQAVETAQDGTFSVRLPGVSKNRNPGWRRRYVFKWEDVSVQDRVRFT